MNPQSGKAWLVNTIVTNHTTCDCCWANGLMTSGGRNLDSDNTCNLTAAGDQPGVNPVLGALANNGGPTRTHALLSGSPAIDTADSSFCPSIDQRWWKRPSGDGCDIGAYELRQ